MGYAGYPRRPSSRRGFQQYVEPNQRPNAVAAPSGLKVKISGLPIWSAEPLTQIADRLPRPIVLFDVAFQSKPQRFGQDVSMALKRDAVKRIQ